MNVRMYAGHALCPDCFDGSVYESETSDPCAYCGKVDQAVPVDTQSDEEWLNALSTLIVDQATRYLTITKRQCDRCSSPATWKIVEYGSATEHLCTDHGTEWFPHLFPLVNAI